ncbi:hypothetical protein ACWOE3_07940 [Enterococcus dispar]|uniref:Uncharacterized protein n=1 Tax=Enterococcus dispar ATCC 51266 TaxID=1139219 RepID=S1NYY0_9ENTE|nr:hypothetical protein [Enterococcus dispar]EOT38269.1 hypothetical protein OMK_02537 [Enterococcus dispar ATCC 51266]EOW86044.1 hypothetical protein I569_01367 [Enterococcus dispar ATCC 51266]
MTDNQKRFKELYIKDCINGSGRMGNELLKLFDEVLAEFNDNSDDMSTFIQSIIDEHTPPEPNELEKLKQENAELRQRQEMSEEALLQLSDMILSK